MLCSIKMSIWIFMIWVWIASFCFWICFMITNVFHFVLHHFVINSIFFSLQRPLISPQISTSVSSSTHNFHQVTAWFFFSSKLDISYPLQVFNLLCGFWFGVFVFCWISWPSLRAKAVRSSPAACLSLWRHLRWDSQMPPSEPSAFLIFFFHFSYSATPSSPVINKALYNLSIWLHFVTDLPIW